MQVLDTSQLSNYNKLNDDSVAQAAANYAFVTATKVLTITDTSVFTAPEAFAAMHVEVFDRLGNSKVGKINAAGGNVAIDLDAAVSLDLSAPVQVRIRLISSSGFEKIGYINDMPVNADIAATAAAFEK